MNIGQYIRLLLPEHDTVIIPGLGAFISAYKPAQVDEKSGEMLPPSREIKFEPKIKNNDGLLAGTIAQEEGIPLTQAYQELENEREEIIYQLDTGNNFVFENLGELYYGDNREIRFISYGKDNLLLDAYGLETTSLASEKDDIPAEDTTPAPAEEITSPKKAFEENIPPVYSGASLTDHRIPPHKRKRAWWLLLFIIPLIAGAIYVFLYSNAEPPSTVEVRIEEPAPVAAIPPADTVATDTLPGADTTAAVDSTAFFDSLTIVDSTTFVTPDPSLFYLVRGSFEDFENANKFLNRLKRQGYKPFHLGKHGSYYLVGIETYNNKIEAYGQQYNFLDKYPESGVWIFIPKKDSILNQ